MRRGAVLLLLLLLVVPSFADEKKPAPPAKHLNKMQTVDAVLAAVAANDGDALAALAAKDSPDPWMVVDELCFRGEHDAADAFAKAAPRADTEKLPAYVEAWRKREPDEADRELLGAMYAAMRANQPQKVVEGTASLSMEPAPDSVERLRLGHVRGMALQAMRRWNDSYTVLDGAAGAAEELGWLVWASRLYYRAGQSAFYGSDFPRSLATKKRLLALAKRRGDRILAARTLVNVGTNHQMLGDYAEALSAFEEALPELKALGNKNGVATTLFNINIVRGFLGDHAKALSALQQVRARFKALNNEAGAARALENIGNTHAQLGDYAKAFEALEKALAEHKALGTRAGATGAARTRGNIGAVHTSLGEYTEALSALEKARSELVALEDRYNAAGTLNTIGNVHFFLGDHAKALSIYEQALGEGTALRNKAGMASTLANIGQVHSFLGDYAKALSVLEQSLVGHTALRNKAGEAATLVMIGNVHSSLGEYEKALSSYKEALKTQVLGDKAAAAVTRVNIGILHSNQGDYPEALSALEQARADLEAMGDKGSAAVALVSIGDVHTSLGDPAAVAAYERALVLLEKTSRAVPRLYALWGLSRVRLAQGDAPAAVDLAREAAEIAAGLAKGLGEEQGARARDLHGTLFAHGVRAAMEADSISDVAFFLESGRARSMLESLGGRDRLHATAVPKALRMEEAHALAVERLALRRYGKAVDEGSEEAAKLWPAVGQARAAIVEITARIQRDAKAQAVLLYPKAAPLARIQATLAAGDVLVLYSLQRSESVALVLGPTTARAVSLGKAEPIEDACEAMVAAVVPPGHRGFKANVPPHRQLPFLIKRLRALLIKPLGLPTETKRLLVSPDGALSSVPFAILAGDKVSVTYVPSGTTYELLRDEQGEHGKRVLALGDPVYDEQQDSAVVGTAWREFQWGPLPGSGKEARAVGDVVLKAEKATVGALREALAREQRWRAVHLACHGVVDMERPVLSALAVTPGPDDHGLLRCLDVYRMQIPADLVVLSACHSGKGKVYKSEGIIGLSRAFMFAGAPRVICSLWKVDDDATRALMIRFYELWHPKDGSKGLGAAAALKQAQAFIRDHPDHDWKRPHYWAAWMLWGLPD